MFAARQIASRVFQQTVRRYHAGEFKAPTMEELPIPRGSWQSHHDAKQRKFNLILIAGLAFSAGTIVMAKVSGLVYLNYSPPKSLD